MDKHNITVLSELILMGIRLPQAAGSIVRVLPHHLHGLSGGQLGHDHPYQDRLQATNPKYFFPWTFGFYWPWLLYNLRTSNARKFCFGSKYNLLLFCAIQLAFFLVFISSEHFILSAMYYDCYVATCNPRSTKLSCHQGYVGCWTIPYLYSAFVYLLITVKTFSLPFCDYNVIRHFYSDSFPLLSLLCSNTHEVEIIILITAGFYLISFFLIVLVSYLLILASTLRMSSDKGRHKAFSNCGSHLEVVTVFYGALIFMYVQPESNHSCNTDKMASIFYTLIQFSSVA